MRLLYERIVPFLGGFGNITGLGRAGAKENTPEGGVAGVDSLGF
jgi:hypothetical protein